MRKFKNANELEWKKRQPESGEKNTCIGNQHSFTHTYKRHDLSLTTTITNATNSNKNNRLLHLYSSHPIVLLLICQMRKNHIKQMLLYMTRERATTKFMILCMWQSLFHVSFQGFFVAHFMSLLLFWNNLLYLFWRFSEENEINKTATKNHFFKIVI